MADNYPYWRNPRGPRNPDLRTPFQKLNEHYIAGPGLNRNLRTTVRDTEAKTTRRDTEAKTTARGLSSGYIRGLGVANPNLMPSGNGDIWSRIRDELRNLRSQDAWTLQRINRGPQQAMPGTSLRGPFAPRKSIMPEAVAASHTPVVPTAERGAPKSSYDRGEGAPTGTTRLQEMVGAGAPPTSPRLSPGRNKYLDMYYSGAAAQQRFLRGMSEERAPIEVIRGTDRTFFSPTTQKEYGSPLEAAIGVEHQPEIARQFEVEKALASRKRFPFTPVKMTDANTFEEKLKIVDENTGRVLSDATTGGDADLQAMQALYPRFVTMGEAEQDEEMAKMNPRQRELLIQMIRQLGAAPTTTR